MKKQRIILLWILAVAFSFWGLTVYNNLTATTATFWTNGVVTINSTWVLQFSWNYAGMQRNYAMYSDSTTQTVSNAANAYPITYDTIDHQINWYTLSGWAWGSRIIVTKAWVYTFQISAISDVDTNGKKIWIWARVNNVDVTGSNTEIIAQSNTTQVIAVPFVFDLNPGDDVSFVLGSDDAGSRIFSIASGSSPTRPSAPSIIVTSRRLWVN